jgi:hypothetical protein
MSDFLLQFTTPAVIGLIITASALVIFHDWRVSFAALALQYVFAAVLFAQIVVVQVVGVRMIVGLFIVVILVVTGREVATGHFGRKAHAKRISAPDENESAPTPWSQTSRIELPTNFPLRLLAAVMIAVAAWYTATQPQFALPGVPVSLNIASYLLIALGLLNLSLTEQPMNAGMGLLTALTGFEMLYAVFEQSLAVAALLAAVDFGVALAVSYLTLLASAVERSKTAR